VLSETGLVVKASEQLRVVIGYNFSFNSRPGDGVKPIDTNLETSLVYSF